MLKLFIAKIIFYPSELAVVISYTYIPNKKYSCCLRSFDTFAAFNFLDNIN